MISVLLFSVFFSPLSLVFRIKKLYCLVLLLLVCACLCICHAMYVEVSGQLCGVSFRQVDPGVRLFYFAPSGNVVGWEIFCFVINYRWKQNSGFPSWLLLILRVGGFLILLGGYGLAAFLHGSTSTWWRSFVPESQGLPPRGLEGRGACWGRSPGSTISSSVGSGVCVLLIPVWLSLILHWEVLFRRGVGLPLTT